MLYDFFKSLSDFEWVLLTILACFAVMLIIAVPVVILAKVISKK